MNTVTFKEFPGSNSNLSLEYDARETLKDFGWQKYYSNAESIVRAEGLELVIFAHFQRSKEGYGAKHPSLEIYSSHWIAANGDRYDAIVMDILKERYGPVRGEQMIAPHASYWDKNWKNGTYYKYVYQHK